ncbi:Response regulator PleD [Rubripirellula lacrimiformis]|uniref:Response regulator PleD n=1 Tax=Rubripirellula lacrimiformis TaxID=1930273 RepID=A0A517NEK8_9BACT|nr:response regulator [Rubripirellula lacrimiformis]QDT05567.1 Response regulator PleD [Rubripirellula lacrimiformis]
MHFEPTVLVVEDDDAIRHGTAMRLNFNGYKVLTANDGEQGTQLAGQHFPDLILMDIRMPRMDGLTALSLLQQDPRTKDIPVIMISASPGDQEKSLECGAKFFLTKPVPNGSMMAAIESALSVPQI